MSNKRNGERKARSDFNLYRKQPQRYIIVTDTEQTEKNYFDGLKSELPKKIQEKVSIRIISTSTKKLISECVRIRQLDPNLSELWIVFDRDKVPNFDAIIKEAQENGINVAWSNPCIEIWFFAYFGKMPTITDSTVCTRKFNEVFKAKTGQEYSKTDKKLYNKLNRFGNEEVAIKKANQRY